MNSSLFDIPFTAPARHRLTVDEYHQMGEAGIFGEDDQVELIDGELIDMAPIGTQHAYIVNLLTRFFAKQASDERLVCVQNPIQLGDHGEPEPDVAVVANHNYAKRHPQPQDIFLLIEVADISLDYEREKKIPFYARFGIPEVWIVNLRERQVEVHRDPATTENRYRNVRQFTEGILTAADVPEVEIVIENLWK